VAFGNLTLPFFFFFFLSFPVSFLGCGAEDRLDKEAEWEIMQAKEQRVKKEREEREEREARERRKLEGKTKKTAASTSTSTSSPAAPGQGGLAKTGGATGGHVGGAAPKALVPENELGEGDFEEEFDDEGDNGAADDNGATERGEGEGGEREEEGAEEEAGDSGADKAQKIRSKTGPSAAGRPKKDKKTWKYTVSIAIPGSVISIAQSTELRTHLAGQVGFLPFNSLALPKSTTAPPLCSIARQGLCAV